MSQRPGRVILLFVLAALAGFAQEPSSRRIGRQGQQDLDQGRLDTGTGPALDATYRKVRGKDTP